jgi:hypothetical protein
VTVSATDTFVNLQGGLQSPPRNSFVITPSDTNELPFVTRSVYVGVTGDMAPLVILDASGRVRTTYRQWRENRGGLEWLATATKRYDTIPRPPRL